MTHLETEVARLKEQVQGLTARTDQLEVELAMRKQGQALAARDNDHYELDWEKQVTDLKGVIADARAFLKGATSVLGNDNPVLRALLVSMESAVGTKVEPKTGFEDFDAQLTIDLLGLVTEHVIPYETIASWTREERMAAERWAAQQHALASDNEFDESEIVPKPVHVRKLEEANPKRDDLSDVDLRVAPLTEHPGVTWAKRMKDSPKEWDRLHRIELAARALRAHYREPDRDMKASEMCRVIDAVELERVQEFQSRDWTHGDPARRKKP